jgi:hypothetical protein
VVDRVVEDVVERVVVLILGLDHLRPEALAEDVVLAAMTLVEGPGVLPVEVSHAVGEVGQGRLDEEVVVVAEEAAGVEAPAVPPLDAPQDLQEDRAVTVVLEDGRVVVPLCPDVVVGAGGEVAVGTSHHATVAAATASNRGFQEPGADLSRTGHVPGKQRGSASHGRRQKGRGRSGQRRFGG